MELTDIQKKTIALVTLLPDIEMRLKENPQDATAVGMLDEVFSQLKGLAEQDERIYHVLNPLIPFVTKVHAEYKGFCCGI